MAYLESIAFALFAIVTVGSSLGVVLVRDVWHSALLLGVALLSVAVRSEERRVGKECRL